PPVDARVLERPGKGTVAPLIRGPGHDGVYVAVEQERPPAARSAIPRHHVGSAREGEGGRLEGGMVFQRLDVRHELVDREPRLPQRAGDEFLDLALLTALAVAPDQLLKKGNDLLAPAVHGLDDLLLPCCGHFAASSNADVSPETRGRDRACGGRRARPRRAAPAARPRPPAPAQTPSPPGAARSPRRAPRPSAACAP